MKKFNKKSLVLLICVTLLLTFAVSGTVAYLVASTEKVTNTFGPAYVTVEVDDKVDGLRKYDVEITNTGNVDAYIRAAIVGYWCNNDGEIVAAWDPTDTDQGEFGGLAGTNWVKNGDYYYYTQPVAPGAQTPSALFESYTVKQAPVEGAHLVMNIMAQAIQAEGTDDDGTKAVVAAWGVDPSTLGN